jgi:starvation-inducible DNA-binding protein
LRASSQAASLEHAQCHVADAPRRRKTLPPTKHPPQPRKWCACNQIFAITDEIAERARKIGGSTLRSVGDISRHQRLKDNDQENVAPEKMLSELRDDNSLLTNFLRQAHEICGRHGDVATTSLIEVWIDQAERRIWFVTEIVSEL